MLSTVQQDSTHGLDPNQATQAAHIFLFQMNNDYYLKPRFQCTTKSKNNFFPKTWFSQEYFECPL